MNELEHNSLLAQLLKLRQEGKAAIPCAQALGLTRYQVEKMLKSDEYRDYALEVAKQINDEIVAFEAEQHKKLSQRLWALDTKVVKTIEKNLDEGKIAAVDTWARLAISKDKSEEKRQDTNIQIVMPGSNTETAVEAEYSTVQPKKEEIDGN